MLFVNVKCSSLAQTFYLLVVSPSTSSGICQMFKRYDLDGRLMLLLNVQGQLSKAKSKLRKCNCFKDFFKKIS